MKHKQSDASAALNYLLKADFETATRTQIVDAEDAVQAEPDMLTLIAAVKAWAKALAAVCRSHVARCTQLIVDRNERDPARAVMNMLGLLLCEHLWLPADTSVLLADKWPEENAVRQFVLQVSGEPIELIDSKLVTPHVLPRWEPKSSFSRRLAGLQPIPAEGEDAAFLTVAETQDALHGLEESFRSALFKSLLTSFSEAKLASYGAAVPKVSMKIPPKKQDMSKYFDGATLTDRQREVMSLQLERGMNTNQIARHLGLHHSTVQERLRAASARITRARGHEKSKKHTAKHNVDG